MCEIKISGEDRDALLRLTEKIAGAMSRESEPTKPVECSAARLTGLHCDECSKEIREGETYFVSEDSFAHIKLEGGERFETKDRAWQTRLLCLKCHNNTQEIFVNHYDRDDDEKDC